MVRSCFFEKVAVIMPKLIKGIICHKGDRSSQLRLLRDGYKLIHEVKFVINFVWFVVHKVLFVKCTQHKHFINSDAVCGSL